MRSGGTACLIAAVGHVRDKGLQAVLLLMEEIPNNQLGCIEPVVNNGINYLSTGARLLPSVYMPHTPKTVLLCWSRR